MALNKSLRRTLDNPWMKLFIELLHRVDKSTIAHCQYYMNCLPLSDLIVLRNQRFTVNFVNLDFVLLNMLDSLDRSKQRSQEHCFSHSFLWSQFIIDYKLSVYYCLIS